MDAGAVPIPFDAALYAAAAAQGARSSLSARAQLESWARLGAALAAQLEAADNKVGLALNGAIALRELSVEQSRQFDAVVAVRIEDAIRDADFTVQGPRIEPMALRDLAP